MSCLSTQDLPLHFHSYTNNFCYFNKKNEHYYAYIMIGICLGTLLLIYRLFNKSKAKIKHITKEEYGWGNSYSVLS